MLPLVIAIGVATCRFDDALEQRLADMLKYTDVHELTRDGTR